jgi:uncharacterized delta-60 repeat protein
MNRSIVCSICLARPNTQKARMSVVVGVVAMLLLSNAWSAPQANAIVLATAAAGDLDQTFGVGGKVTADFGRYSSIGNALAIQTDGKIIAAGNSSAIGIFFGDDFIVARFNPDGSLDSTFGSGGRVITDFFAYQDQIRDVAIQPDGKIVAVGFARTSAVPLSYVAIVRYNPDGSVDQSFGSGGTVLTLPPGGFGFGNAVVVQPDGRIVVAGRSDDEGSADFALWRYNPDGTVDSSFGDGGFVSTDFFGGFNGAFSLILQPDGKLVAGGFEGHDSTGSNYALVRYNPDGGLDATFGSGGRVSTDFFGLDEIGRALALQSDGKLVMAGEVRPNEDDSLFGVARYNPNGTLDSSFGSGGKIASNVFGPVGINYAVMIQSTGKIVSAGFGLAGSPPHVAFALVRFNPDGSLDPSFGSGGGVITSIGRAAFASDLALQSDGKIVALGYSNDGSGALFALARYDGWGFDFCLQDDRSGNLLQFNSTNGDYQFTDCRKGITLTGTGKVTNDPYGCKITLQDSGPIPKRPDRSVLVQANRCTHTARASILIFSTGSSFSITDTDITNNTCACR